MPAPAEIYDGMQTALGGMNSNVRPWLLPENQVANLINGACRGGAIGNRPAFIKTSLTFANPDAQARWNGGNVQCAAVYAFPGAPERIIVSVAGQILRLTAQANGSFLVETFMPAGDAGNDATKARAYMCQSDKWFIIQDGTAVPLLIYGDAIRRATTTAGNGTSTYTEMPVGTFMAYGYGRTWLCTGPREYKASDLIGERGAVDGTGAQSSYEVVTFDDQMYLAENSSFLLPRKFGNVTGMGFVSQQDTATGQGPLIVFGQNGAEAVNASADRSTWQTTQIQVEALINFGAQGDLSIVSVNGDLFFRAADGYRSYKQARAEQGQWGSLPTSTAVRSYTDGEIANRLAWGSAIFFNNRLITTCYPSVSGSITNHVGLLALDFDPISTSIGVSTQPPAWDGYWVPPRPPAKLVAGMFLNQNRAFVISSLPKLAPPGSTDPITTTNTLDEILENHRFDDDTIPIATTILTRAFNFKSPFQEKQLLRVEVSTIDRTRTTTIAIAYANNGNAVFQNLTLANPSQTGPNIFLKNVPVAIGGEPQYTVDNRTSFPDVSGNTSDTRLNRRFYRLQLQIVLTGSQTLDQIRVVADPLEENKRGGTT